METRKQTLISDSRRKPRTYRTNTQLTNTTSNLSQTLKLTMRSETVAPDARETRDATSPDDEMSLVLDDLNLDVSDDLDQLEGTRSSPSRDTIADRARRAEWFVSPIHRTERVDPRGNALVEQLRGGAESPSLDYTLGSQKFPPSPRFGVESPDNVQHLGRPDRRVLWEDVDRGRKRLAETRQSTSGVIRSSGAFNGYRPISQTPRPHTASGLPTKSQRTRLTAEQLHAKSTQKSAPLVTRSLPSLETKSPYATRITRLRLEGLKLEEDILLELKRQQELERMRGPLPRWYELRTREFHYEAKRNNDMLHHSAEWQDMLEYTKKLIGTSSSSAQ